MNYSVEIDINRPINEVITLFIDSDNLLSWQHNLLGVEVINGEPGKVGTESRLLYNMGNKEVVMTEVITVNQLPDKYCAVYETDNVWNLMENQFIDLGDDKTRWICKNEFKCSGFVRLMAMLMPSIFKKQSERNQQQFKAFVESQSK
ncbi:SRPBCC family protein [Thalassotalea maritima]|uniref:SRPBCC family protein n=1 Tax=Thalassotalea maritima TaxID=3242416 RepID=UPI0035281639